MKVINAAIFKSLKIEPDEHASLNNHIFCQQPTTHQQTVMTPAVNEFDKMRENIRKIRKKVSAEMHENGRSIREEINFPFDWSNTRGF